MFIGHFAAAFATKRAAPRVSLGVLVAAAQLPDLLWPPFLIVGWERVRIAAGDTAFTPLDFEHYPWTHSLLATGVWALLAALIYRAWSKDERGAIAVGVLVLSHWVLDFISHRPDLPLYPGGTARMGLGLWNSVVATVLVEAVMFAVGLGLYVAATRARDRIGQLGFWAFVIFLLVIAIANIFSPAPPSAEVLARSALALWLLPPLAWWVDRHRDPPIVSDPRARAT